VGKVGKKYETSHLNGYVMKCEKKKNKDMGKMILAFLGKLKGQEKIDQMIYIELLSNLIRHNLSYKFVEYPEFSIWTNYMFLRQLWFLETILKLILKEYMQKEKTIFKKLFASCPSMIFLIYNLWTFINNKSFITYNLDSHFVDLNWNIINKLHNFCHMPPPHICFEFFKKISDFLQDFELEKKVFSFTLDNVFVNEVLQNTLRSQLLLQNDFIYCDCWT